MLNECNPGPDVFATFFDFDFAPFFEGKGFARLGESGGGGGGGGVQCKLDETWVSPYSHFVSI